MERRVRYFQRNDLCFGLGMDKMEEMSIPEYDVIAINDAIEYYQIKLYFDDGIRAKDWSDKQYDSYKEKSKVLFELCVRFFNAIKEDTLIQQYERVEVFYRSAFWELFDYCKLYNRISSDTFGQLSKSENIMPEDLFAYKGIVQAYGSALRTYLLRSEYGARIYVHAYEQNYSTSSDFTKLYLPKEFSSDDKLKLLMNYINSQHPNMNILLSIFRMKQIDGFPISDMIRLRAKQRYDEEAKNIVDSGRGICTPFKVSVAIKKEQTEEAVLRREGLHFNYSFSEAWLKESLDYPSVLNNFIYLFQYVDAGQMRCQLVSKKRNIGIFERTMHGDLKNLYPETYSFQMSNIAAHLQMITYCIFLSEHGIELENILKWFFTEYLQTEFGCPEIRISFPDKNTSYSDRCVKLCIALDSLLKQYKAYLDYKEIDFALIQISSSSVKFQNIQSLINSKYLYGAGNEYEWLANCLFSDQNMMSFVKRIHDEGREYRTLYELLKSEIVYVSDFLESDIPNLEKLEQYDLVTIRDDTIVRLVNNVKSMILMDLYYNDVISRYHYPEEAQIVFDEWLQKGLLQEEGTLLSKPEIQYFNYLLNDAEFINGPKIRNNYIHGVTQTITDEDTHRNNYYTLLSIITILAIKINDEFCLYHKLVDKKE